MSEYICIKDYNHKYIGIIYVGNIVSIKPHDIYRSYYVLEYRSMSSLIHILEKYSCFMLLSEYRDLKLRELLYE